MNSASQDKPQEAKDPAEELFKDKWFWPILDELREFQIATKHLFFAAEEVLNDDAPAWSFLAAWTCGKEFADYTGLDLPQNFTARNLGKMMGAEWNLCDVYARSYPILKALTPKVI